MNTASIRRVTLAFALLLGLAAYSHSEEVKSDPWLPTRFLLGQWLGTATGAAGQGGAGRQYEFVLNGQFIRETSNIVYPPKDRSAPQEVHEHWGFMSYDRGRNRILLRQFYAEGFVYQFVLDPAHSTRKKLIFESERLESFRNKWRARLTYEVQGAGKFTEIFELAPPDTRLQVYSKIEFRKID